MSRHPFNDPATGREFTLVNDGCVEHPGCALLADVFPDLDCFYCPMCGCSGRISGAGVVAVLTRDDMTTSQVAGPVIELGAVADPAAPPVGRLT